jgi:hypothetical protein
MNMRIPIEAVYSVALVAATVVFYTKSRRIPDPLGSG